MKDLFAVAGYPCFAGSSRRLPADPWERDGPLVATLGRQLGVIMGKTHMVEFALGTPAGTAHHGAPYNPWDAAAHRSVGGSSSGAGVGLLERSALLAFGSGTGGLGAYLGVDDRQCRAEGHDRALALRRCRAAIFTFDTPGLLARSVSDLAYGFAALDPAGIDPDSLYFASRHARSHRDSDRRWRSIPLAVTAIQELPKPYRKLSMLSFAPAPLHAISPCRKRKRHMACSSMATSAQSNCAVFSTGNCPSGSISSTR